MSNKQKRKTKVLLSILGIISLCLGIAGILLPVLPTTPFLLLASFLFCKSSKKLYNWLENSRVLGEYIRNYRRYRAVKRSTKIISIIFLWATLFISIYFVDILYVRIILIAVGIGVSVHLIHIKTLENILEQTKRETDYDEGE